MLRHTTFTFLLFSILFTLTTTKSDFQTDLCVNIVAPSSEMQVSKPSSSITDYTFSNLGYSDIPTGATPTIVTSNNPFPTVKEPTL